MHCKNGNSGNEENCKNFNINLSKIKTNEQEIKEDKTETRAQARSNEDSSLNNEYCDNIAAGSTADVRDSSSVQNISNPGGADSDILAPKIAGSPGKNFSRVKIDEGQQSRGGTVLQAEKELTPTFERKTQLLNKRKSDGSALLKRESVSHKKSVLGNNRKVNQIRVVGVTEVSPLFRYPERIVTSSWSRARSSNRGSA